MKRLLFFTLLLTTMLMQTVRLHAAQIAGIEITGAESMTFGADPNTAYANNYSLKVTDSDGNAMTSEQVMNAASDLKVTWDIPGFKTENDTEGQYCDSYGSFTINNAAALSTVFELRDVPMNFYGYIEATMKFGGKTITARKYVVALGNKQQLATRLVPLPGYPVNYSAYPDVLNGYTVTKETYGAQQDVILGGWCVAGSDTHQATLLTDTDGKKFVRLTAVTAKKSHVMTRSVTPPTGRVTYSALLRFNGAGGGLTLTGGYPFWNSRRYTNPVALSFDGTNILLNGTKLSNGTADAVFAQGQWYQVALSIDKANETCYAFVYNEQGELLGETPTLAWLETSDPSYLSLAMGNSNGSGSVDMASFEAYLPQVNADDLAITADKTTLSIPNGETATLTVRAYDQKGYEIKQSPTWGIAEQDMQSALVITPDATDARTVTVTPTADANTGTVNVQVNMNGTVKNIELTLTSSSEGIKFTQSRSSIDIPLDANETSNTVYTAIVVDGQGNDLNRNVTLTAYEKDGSTPFRNKGGISFDAQSGTLSVTAEAQATQLVISATSRNTDGEPIARSTTVNIHGMNFDFGLSSDVAVADGYTPVNVQTAYNETNGYGIISGTPTEGGTASTDNATADWLEGDMQFNFKVQKGFYYTVSITYQGTLTTGYINSDLAGYSLGTQSAMTTAEYTIPATRDFIDLRLAADGTTVARIASLTVSKQPVRQKRAKRMVHHIGDSTSANNGSWAYRLQRILAGDYPDLYALCDFTNRGAGGRNLCTYYTQGKLAAVLLDICPDDVVMFGNNGTNGMGSNYEADMNYYLDAAETFGAKIIINSYTPHGAVSNYAGGYNAATATFDSYRRDAYETIVRKVAAEREQIDNNYIGFVEIGKNADAIFNAYAADFAANNYATANDAAQKIIECFTDHNHYSNGTLACDLMLGGYNTCDAKGIVEQLTLLLGDNEPTPVNNVGVSNCKINTGIYDIQGHLITPTAHLANGIYIINGKKVVK